MKISDLGFDNLVPSRQRPADVHAELRAFADNISSGGFSDVDEREFVLPPIEQWVNDPYYVGEWALHHDKGGLYPALRQSVIDAWNPKFTEIILAGSAGCGKTNRACLLLLRLLQELLCYKHPGRALGLSSASMLVIAFASVSKQKSKDVGFDRFASMVKGSAFIMDHFPPNRKFTGKLVFEEKKISCKPVVSGERGILSEDLIGLLVDEAAFMDVTEKSKKARGESQTYDSAESLYHQANARMRTRFHDNRRQMPGKVIIASSAQFPDDFVSRRRLEVAQTGDESTYVSDLPIWKAKPEGTYSKHTFRVEIGDEDRYSRILEDGDEPRPNSRVIDVPVDLRKDFEADIDRAIRDLAGVPLLTLAPLITNRQAVRDCIRTVEGGYHEYETLHPYETETTTLTDGCDFIWNYLCVQGKDGSWSPRVGVEMSRVIHYDPSFVEDATGFAMGHISSVNFANEKDPITGTVETVSKVGVYIDVMLQVICPDEPGAEISWHALERLTEKLTEHGFDIALVSTDSPAGRSFVQRFRDLGYYAEMASADKTLEPYLTFRKLVNEKLISFYNYPPFMREVYRLEWNKRRNKVDHPRSSIGGYRPSKDVADAVTMVAYHIATRHEEFDTSGPPISFGAF